MNRRNSRALRRRSACMTMLIVMMLAGCQGIPDVPRTVLSWPKKKTSPPHGDVVKMVGTWKDTVAYRPGSPASRGFGGRIYFYDRENQPTKVEGQLVIYAYDETKSPTGTRSRPDRRYVFSPEQLVGHYSEGVAGPSYSVWLPWDAIGGPPQQVTLVPTFRPQQGSVVVAEEARQMLSGETALAEHSSTKHHPISRTSFDVATATTGTPLTPNGEMPPSDGSVIANASHLAEKDDWQIQTTTIAVPPSMHRWLQTSAAPTPTSPAAALASVPTSAHPIMGQQTQSIALPTSGLPLPITPGDSAPGPLPAASAPNVQSPIDRHPWRPSPATRRLWPNPAAGPIAPRGL